MTSFDDQTSMLGGSSPVPQSFDLTAPRVEHLAEMTLIDENTQLILTDDPIRKSQAI